MPRWLDSEYNRLAGAVEKAHERRRPVAARPEAQPAAPTAEEIAAVKFVQSLQAKTDWTKRILAELPPEDEDIELVAGAD